MNNKRCIVNLSTERYWPGQDRLIESLRNNTDADILTFRHEYEVGAKPHIENNYSFKPLAMLKACEAGYTSIIWLDASMNVIRPLNPIFELIESDGYFFQDSGWMNERWTNEIARVYFGTNEGRMLSSGVLGVNFESETGKSFFTRWHIAMSNGMFNGSWENYRHDQSCASLIAHTMGLKLQDGNTFFVYGKEDEPTISDKTLILADGIAF